MNIRASHNGRIFQSTPGQFRFQIPVTFTDISAGPTGILKIMIEGIQVNSELKKLNKEVRIYNYKVNDETEDDSLSEIIGVLIKDRPVAFKNVDGKNENTLVFDFTLGQDDGYEQELTSTSFLVSLTFDSHIKISLNISLEIDHAQKLITIDSIKRVDSSVMVNTNILLLSCIVFLLILWNYFEKDAYGSQNAIVKTIPLIAGALFTFLGVSVMKVRSFVSNLRNFKSVWRFPELHLNLDLFDSFKSPGWLAILGIIILLLSAFKIYFHPIKLNKNYDENKYVSYDRAEAKKFTNEYLYLGNLYFGEGRFGLIENQDSNKSLIANFDTWGKIKPKFLKINNKSAISEVKRSHEYTSIIEFLEDKSFEKYHEKVRDSLNQKPNKDTVEITIADFELWKKADIAVFFKKNKDSLKKVKDWETLFDERNIQLEKISKRIRNSRKNNFLVKQSEILEFSIKKLKEVKGKTSKGKIERLLLLSAICRESREKIQEDVVNDSLKKTLDNIITELLIPQSHWKVDRVLHEFLIEFSLLSPDLIDIDMSTVINSYFAQINGNEEDIVFRKASYILTYLNKLYNEGPEITHISDFLRTVKKWQPDILEYMTNIDVYKKDPFLIVSLTKDKLIRYLEENSV